MKLVLIGGSGFVGQQILRLNLEQKNPFCIHSLHRRPLNTNFTHVQKYLGSLKELPEYLFPEEPHVLIHFGVKQIDDGEGFWENNVVDLNNLLGHANAYTLGILYSSSLSVLGQGSQVDVTETTPTKPETSLSKSRLAAEQRILEFARRQRIAAYCLRPRFVIGEKDQFVLPGFAKLAKHGFIIGSGNQAFSIINVEDYATLILDLCKTILTGQMLVEQSPLHVGYANPISYKQIISLIQQKLSCNPLRKRIPLGFHHLLNRIPWESGIRSAARFQLLGLDHYGCTQKLQSLVHNGVPQGSSVSVIKKVLSKHPSFSGNSHSLTETQAGITL